MRRLRTKCLSVHSLVSRAVHRSLQLKIVFRIAYRCFQLKILVVATLVRLFAGDVEQKRAKSVHKIYTGAGSFVSACIDLDCFLVPSRPLGSHTKNCTRSAKPGRGASAPWVRNFRSKAAVYVAAIYLCLPVNETTSHALYK